MFHGRGGAAAAAVLALVSAGVAAGAHHALRGAARVAQLTQTLPQRHGVAVTVQVQLLQVPRAAAPPPQPLEPHLAALVVRVGGAAGGPQADLVVAEGDAAGRGQQRPALLRAEVVVGLGRGDGAAPCRFLMCFMQISYVLP